MLITQNVGASITQGFAQAPAPAGGTTGGGTTTGSVGYPFTAHRYLGGLSGAAEPEPFPLGPVLVRYRDDEGNTRVDVLEAIEQDPDPPAGVVINAGAVCWQQVIAWCPLAELDL